MLRRILCAIFSLNFIFCGVSTFVYASSQGDLSKCELSGIRKKNWSQRLKWFESKIIDYYKKLNKSNVLVVGDQDFLDSFELASKNNGWNVKFKYSLVPVSDKDYDLVIDSKYNPKHFGSLYENLDVSSFQNVYIEILISEALEFFKKNDVKYYFFEGPMHFKVKGLNDLDKTFFNTGKGLDRLFRENRDEIINVLYQDCPDCREFISKHYNYGQENKFCNIDNGKYRIKKDCDYGDLLQIKNGYRRTYYVPENDTNYFKIYMIGPCLVEGSRTCDKCTIESFIQSKINEKNVKYEMINYGNGAGWDWINDIERVLDTPLQKGDCVIHLAGKNSILYKVLEKYGIEVRETSSLFNRPGDHGPWMIDDGFHINHTGNKVLADYIYKVIEPDLKDSESNGIEVKYEFENEIDTFLEDNPEFKSYLDNLKKIRDEKNITGKIGSIVMNCNPFTLGHRYLIDQALSKVDHLYIFVVEEDKSIFPFKDRIDLVKKGISDISDKVTVLPSGKWMISLLTFPEYFSKDSLQEDTIDPSKDVTLFGKYICPSLNISQRFVGEEPFDSVTKQYNDSMKSILPKYGVILNEIPRNCIDDEHVISASKVREIIKTHLSMLKQYVPDSTLDYLEQNYKLLV